MAAVQPEGWVDFVAMVEGLATEVGEVAAGVLGDREAAAMGEMVVEVGVVKGREVVEVGVVKGKEVVAGAGVVKEREVVVGGREVEWARAGVRRRVGGTGGEAEMVAMEVAVAVAEAAAETAEAMAAELAETAAAEVMGKLEVGMKMAAAGDLVEVAAMD